ncbi:hypothetical protein SAMD00019534_064450 [Acytostelium subglobosum LB1]|uniref:hypothetical protein n=1 Tax=Acytostelium subglobosum LB1 TaxID=1410327 RepID=UPI0006451FBA|nr:hypothetical protein SAMD00019534_064450 [Acytostelium subglobosum LB1]GAM23270.1 hypothetical protein SAMD00019534_064450 [Acytostelium subglobosum LB1]|eukprot:XP_012753719.1 hypothetical protein SAMD00019534_064450 [Acytostelium subglobosum LB1]
MSKTFGKDEVKAFAQLSGDHNPIHLDEVYASGTRFKRPLIHGMLVASMLSSTVASKLPGPGSIYMKQELNFIKPAYVGDTIRAEVVVESIVGSKILLKTTCIAISPETGDETVVISGPALVYHPDVKGSNNN